MGRSRAGQSVHITSIRGVSAGPALALVFPKERLVAMPHWGRRPGHGNPSWTWSRATSSPQGTRTGWPGQAGLQAAPGSGRSPVMTWEPVAQGASHMSGGLTLSFPENLWLPLKTGSFLITVCLSLQLSCHLDFGFHSIIVSWPHKNVAQDNKGLIQELSRESRCWRINKCKVLLEWPMWASACGPQNSVLLWDSGEGAGGERERGERRERERARARAGSQAAASEDLSLSSKTVPSNGFGSGREQLTNPRWPGSSPPT